MTSSYGPILTAPRMKFDNVAWDRSDAIYAAWKKKLFHKDVLREIGHFIIRACRIDSPPEELCNPQKGAFNVVFRMKFANGGGSALIRFPIPGISMFAEEKIRREVSVMRFLEQNTSIRVPHVFHYGMTEESPAGLGPFIVMDYIENDADMVDALNTPGLSDDDRCVLDPRIDETRLRSVYSDMADILLQFSRKSFERIGSIARNEEDNEWVVDCRPLTINMNELVQLADFPAHLLPQTTFDTAPAYFLALAEMHMIHLSIQRNGAVDSAEDCRREYIARCLFRKLARENRLCLYDNGPFKLFCDDFRPTNVLANSLNGYKAVGAIDWEFTYAAPAEFAYSPPAWLLLERPEYWPAGLDDWTLVYENRLAVFLQELEKLEETTTTTTSIQRGVPAEEHNRLSQRMRESWQSGDFWVCYAARRSWAFDMLYWAKIDRRFFGEGGLEDRFKLLTEEEKIGIDGFVQRKMAEKRRLSG